MKYLLSLGTMWLFSFSLSGQCCPYMGEIEMLPANPQAGENVSIITNVATPNFGYLITSTHVIINDTIWIDACYHSGMLTVVTQISDTLNIGPLAAGNYGVVFRASVSDDPVECIPVDQNQLDTNFTVGIAGVGDVVSDQLVLYPNPVTDQLFIGNEATAINVYTSTGQLVDLTFNPTNEGLVADVQHLSPGAYLITFKLKNSSEMIRYQFIK